MVYSTLRGAATAALLAGTAFAGIFEKLHAVPEGYKLEGPALASQKIELQIALTQGDAEGFDKVMMDMSTPEHPNYGKHFESHEEMKRMLQPSQSAIESVTAWLQEHDIEDFKVSDDWIDIKTTVGKASALLDTKFNWYVSTDAKHIRKLRTLQVSVPDDVSEHISLIEPTTRFPTLQAHHTSGQRMPGTPDLAGVRFHHSGASFKGAADPPLNVTACNNTITPQCLQYIYKIDYKADPKSGSNVAFSSYLEQYARYSDLDLFTTNVYPQAKGQNFSVVQYNGGLNTQNSTEDSGEANLDLQYMLAIAGGLPVTEYSTGGRGPLVPDADQPDPKENFNEPYLEFLRELIKEPKEKLPLVLSTSYGENEQSVTEKYARSVCNLYQQLGSRGVSVIFSSGDSGVGAACLSNDGKNTTKFQPQYPASCPYVTSVGSTRSLDEYATGFSSGGFSDLWKRPKYQEKAVSAFLAAHGNDNNQAQYYNAKGRGFPDVSAQGYRYAVYEHGKLGYFQGTSASAPMFGGIIGLLNDARLRKKQPPLGFLNPLLYSQKTAAAKGFNDIKKGGSIGCNGKGRFNGPPNGTPVIPFASWNATEGWDPVTGLGTPNFPGLLKAAMGNRYRG